MVNIYKITVDGTTYDVEVELIGAPTTAMASMIEAPRATGASFPPSLRRRPEAPKAGTWSNSNISTVRSPMAGSVCEIRIGLNEVVEAGQVVMLLEAMKMENEITAPCDGVITRLAVKEGQLVSSGDDLFEVR